MKKQNWRKVLSFVLCIAMVLSCNVQVFAVGIDISDNGTYLDTKQSEVKSDAKVKAVEALIEAIGKVEYTDDCLAKIVAAEKAYNKLTAEQREQVENYGTLKAARYAYNALAADKVDTSNLTVTDSGTIGNLKWAVYTNGLLEISGDGAIPSYAAGGAPWYSYASSIKAILVRSSVTGIGAFAFYGCNNVTEITLPFVGESRTATGPKGTFGYIFGYTASIVTRSTSSSSRTMYSSTSSSSDFSQSYTVGTSTSYNDTAFINGLSSYDSSAWDKPWYTCQDGEFKQPSSPYCTYYGQIQTYTFNVPTALKTVTITDASKIETAAFNNCKNITKIVLNDGITSIADCAFQNSGVKDFAIPDSVNTIGKYFCYGCTGLTEMSIPNAVTIIPSYAFYGCKYISKLTLSRNTNSIGDYAFYNCSGISKLVIPDKTETIGAHAFDGCSKVHAIRIPDSVTSIGSYAFNGCASATTLSIGSGLKTVPKYAFGNCTGFTSVTVPKTVTSIQAFAFYGCNNVTDITLPFVGESRTATGPKGTFGYIFGYTASIVTRSTSSSSRTMYSSTSSSSDFSQSYTVGTSTSYNDTAFINGLSSYDSSAWDKPWYTCQDGEFKQPSSPYCTYYGQIQTYTFNVPTALKTVTITDASKIETAAFNNCKNITKIVLNDGITSIGDYAFQNNPWFKGLSDEFVIAGDSVLIKYNGTKSGVVVPDTVKSIAGGVFKSKTTISSVTLPDNLLSIGENAFDGCTNLTAITIPKSVVEIGSNAIPYACTISVYRPSAGYDYRSTNRIVLNSSFTTGNETYYYVVNDDGCAEIIGCTTTSTEITVPTDFDGIVVNKIGDYGFANCTTLNSITIPANILNIGKYAFDGCTGLVNATIPTTVDTVGDYAFNNCTGLVNVTISEGVQALGEGAFYNCTSLIEAVVPETAKYVGSYAFYNCTSMVTATIGTTAEAIGDYTFYNCEKLENIVVGYSVKTIGDYAFYNCALGRVSIPSATVSIGDYAFAENDQMTKATLRKNLLTIGNGAFRNCSALATVSIPSTVTSIGIEAFENCSSISAITIPVGVTEINNRAFSNCSSLASVTINGEVTRIGISAFYNNAFESITLPETVAVLDDSSFRHCANLKETTLPTSVTTLGDAVFFECSALGNASMPDSVTSVGRGVFFYNDDITVQIRKNTGTLADRILEQQGVHHVILDADISTIGNNAFDSCYELSTITYGEETVNTGEYKFSAAVKSIGSEAFKDNPLLCNLIVPDTLETLGENAFYNVVQSGYHCDDVTVTFYYVSGMIAANILDSQYIWHIVINDNIHTLSEKAFYNCPVLETVSIPDTISSVGANVFANPGKNVTATFRGVDGTIDASVYDGKTTGLKYIAVDENVDTIADYAFANTDTVIGVVIVNTDNIGSHAFYQGKVLDYVEISACEDINDYAFSNCLSLQIVYIDSVVNINDYAFFNDIAINNLYIDADLYHIGDHAFESCKSIPNVVLPETVREIGAYAFYDCNSMKSIDIPIGVAAIKEYTFFGCASLTEIDIPNTVVSIGDYAYYGCVVAQYLNLSNAVESIGAYAFYNCNQVKEINLPNTLKSIGNYAFRSCSSITEISIPDSVTELGDCVFYACTGLEQAEFGIGITRIGNSEFYGCVKLAKLMLNGDVEYIHDLAFYGAEDAVIYSFENQYVEDYCNDNGLEYHELANDFTMTLTPPVKIEYLELEELDLTGLALNVTYTTGSERTITSGYTISGYDPTALGTQTITVTYRGVSQTFDVTVLPKEVSFITATPKTAMRSIVGEELDMSNVIITVSFVDGTSKIIDSGYTLDGFDKETIGDQTVTLTYRDKNCTFNVTVIDYIPGDINGDGAVNSDDYEMIISYVRCCSTLTEEQKEIADINGDGAVDAFDAIQLDLYLNGYVDINGKQYNTK